MDRQIPANVLADLAHRGLDVGYLDRMALSPFLSATTGNLPKHIPGYTPIYRPNTDPVLAYITSGKVPQDVAAQVTLRKAAEKAITWLDNEVKAAGTHLLALLDEMVN
jgi:hypothetical protein